MAVIERQDGIKFIAQVYRERIGVMNKRLLAEEIRTLCDQHGQYLSIMRKMKGELEIAISPLQGYLLGELVWDYFSRLDNLIFCEAVAESAHCILVVIRAGAVYLDTRLLSSQVYDELLPIFSDQVAYDVYTYGDVAIRDTDTFGDATFKLPKKMVAKFNHLKVSVFDKLLPSPEFELQPLPVMLRSKYVRSRTTSVTVLAVLIVFVMGWWYFSTMSSTTRSLPVQRASLPSVQQYDLALSSPAPTALINELTKKIEQLYLIPGWNAAHITFNGGKYRVDMHSQGGDLWYLTDWAKQHYYELRMTSDGAELTLESHLKKRDLHKHYPDMQSAVDTFVERMRQVLTATAVHVGASQQYGLMQETRFTLDLNKLSPDLLDLIGQELEDLPLSLSSIDLRLQDGLIDGKIQLSVWGR